MKKGLIIAGVVVVVAVLAFVFLKPKKITPNGAEKSSSQAQKEATKEEDGGILSDLSKIKDAITGGKKMECTYEMKDENGKNFIETKTWTEGKKFKSLSVIDKKNQYSLSDGETIYSWIEGETKGTKMTYACLKELNESVPKPEGDSTQDNTWETPENIKDVLDDSTNVKCQPVLSIDFSVPSGVNFEDTCEQIKNFIGGMKDLQKNFPSQ